MQAMETSSFLSIISIVVELFFFSSLSYHSRKELFFLECDVGQTEFTPPGLISLNKVSSPLLGQYK